MIQTLKRKVTGKYVRYFSVTFELLPGGWNLKPRWYRFDHKKHDSEYREGDFQWLFFSFNWYRNVV